MNGYKAGYALLFSYEVSSVTTIGMLHNACSRGEFSEAMQFGDKFVAQASVAAQGGKFGDLGVVTNQFDKLKDYQ